MISGTLESTDRPLPATQLRGDVRKTLVQAGKKMIIRSAENCFGQHRSIALILAGSRTRVRRCQKIAFTLVEILVVVSIIALLVAVLLPALARSREHARTILCLSHLEQQGVALQAYSTQNRARLPWAGTFRYTLLEGEYYVGGKRTPPHWEVVNLGLLFPKYIGLNPAPFYCPNNRGVEEYADNGRSRFLEVFRNQHPKDPKYHTAHDLPYHPYSAYGYAVPVMAAQSPRDAGSKMYPDECIRYGNTADAAEYPYWKFLKNPDDPAPSFLYPSPQATRGKNNCPALVSDSYFTGVNEGDHRIYEGYHLNSYNVLYSDYHAKRVLDPNGQIHTADLIPVHAIFSSQRVDNDNKVYKVWEYFSKNP